MMIQTEQKSDIGKPVAPRKRAPGGGRPSIAGVIGGGESKVYRLRVTTEQNAKINRRGGGAWLRKLIDAA